MAVFHARSAAHEHLLRLPSIPDNTRTDTWHASMHKGRNEHENEVDKWNAETEENVNKYVMMNTTERKKAIKRLSVIEPLRKRKMAATCHGQ